MKGNRNVSWGKGKTWALYKCAREETKGFIVWICTSPGTLFPSPPSHKWHMIMFLGKLGSIAKPHPHHTDRHLKRWCLSFLPAFSFIFFLPLSLPALFCSHPPSFCCSKCLHSLLPYFCRFPSVICSTFPVPPALLGAPVMPYWSKLPAYEAELQFNTTQMKKLWRR